MSCRVVDSLFKINGELMKMDIIHRVHTSPWDRVMALASVNKLPGDSFSQLFKTRVRRRLDYLRPSRLIKRIFLIHGLVRVFVALMGI